MVELTVSEILKATKGSLIQGSVNQVISNIGTDSRTIKPGDLFLALNGDNFKGEDFIHQALAKGASGYIAQTSKIKNQKSNIVIKVDSPLKALQDIGHYILQRVKPKVIAITGSTGKTSVKEMLKSILSLKHEVVASKANYNNEIGLPLTLLELQPKTEIVILEMAMRGLGQISELCRIAPPDLAVITNIGFSHMELLKTQSNIISAKAEIIDGLKDNGLVFLNRDDEATEKLLRLPRSSDKSESLAMTSLRGAQQICKATWQSNKIVFFSKRDKADVFYSDLSLDEFARPSFVLNYRSTVNGQRSTVKIKLPIAGRHNVINACAAAAVALQLGMSLADIKKGLENIESFSGRLQVSQANDWIILNDSYNASPASMEAALGVLSDIQARRKLAVLGDMLELGSVSSEEHIKLGHLVAKSGVNRMFTIGNLSVKVGQAAMAAGMSSENVHTFRDCSELNREIISYLRPGDAILIKASRALKLDKVAHYLQKKR